MAFTLHPRLAQGSYFIGNLAGCQLLLKDNSIFPWLLLVPEVAGIEDLHELSPEQYLAVTGAIRRVSEFVSQHFRPEKLNVACIGNMVRQMHIHIVGRTPQDPAWPGTVWAFDGKQAYSKEEAASICAASRSFLKIPSPQ
jgi:diadenosine tetraphosphate (Ap4A) HIT family hydrolase